MSASDGAGLLGALVSSGAVDKAAELWQNRNIDGMGRLLQTGALSEKGYMTGMLVNTFSEIGKEWLALGKIQAEADKEIQLALLKLIGDAAQHEQTVQMRCLDLAEKKLEMESKIAGHNSEIAKLVKEMNTESYNAVFRVYAEVPEANRSSAIEVINMMFNRSLQSIDKIDDTNKELIRRGLDPAFIKECASQNTLLFGELCKTLKESYASNQQRIAGMSGVFVDGARAIFGLTSQLDSAPKVIEGGSAGAITDQSGGSGSPSTTSSTNPPIVEGL